MWLFNHSTSVRLTVGFLAVLCVFVAALLITLNNLGNVKRVSEQTRKTQETRRQALKVGRLADQLFSYQYNFIESEGIDFDTVGKFHSTYQEMQDTLNTLLEESSVGQTERRQLEALDARTRRLRDLFFTNVVKTKYLVEDGVASPEKLTDLHRQSRSVLTQIADLNDRLGSIFESDLSTAEKEAQEAWEYSLLTSWIMLVLALICSFLVIFYVHRSIVVPVNQLIDGTEQIADGDLDRRGEVHGAGEFEELAASFNQMTEALQSNQRQLVQSEKLATIGRLAAGVAHEINNPIAVILGYTRMLTSKKEDEDDMEAEALRTIDEEARQCKTLADGLLQLARPSDEEEEDEGRREELSPSDLVSEVLNLAQVLKLTEQVEIERDVLNRPLVLTIGRTRLRQVILNLVSNALEELREVEDPKLRVFSYITRNGAADEAEEEEETAEREKKIAFCIEDNGRGIPDEYLDHLFEPFFTTKERGTGLGLAITYNIIEAHRGTIDVETTRGEGTTFTVQFPVLREGAPDSSTADLDAETAQESRA